MRFDGSVDRLLVVDVIPDEVTDFSLGYDDHPTDYALQHIVVLLIVTAHDNLEKVAALPL